ncbi:MAG: lysophospholipid acyltransferase family protein [Anaerolineales bacterium]
MADTYQIPLFNQIARRIMRPSFRFAFRLLGSVRLKGFEHIPEKGAYVIAINHISLFEVPFMAAFWPTPMEIIGAADVWRRPGQSLIARLYHGIKVKRRQFDRRVFQETMKVLRSKKPLMIAPEGGRTHEPGLVRGKPGIAYIVEKARVPVVPVGIVGTTDDYLQKALTLKQPALEMRVGEPIRLPPIQGKGEERRAHRQKNTDIIMAHIAKLLPPDYRGYYEDYQRFLTGIENQAD